MLVAVCLRCVSWGAGPRGTVRDFEQSSDTNCNSNLYISDIRGDTIVSKSSRLGVSLGKTSQEVSSSITTV